MSFHCEDCGKMFQSLTRLRSHECDREADSDGGWINSSVSNENASLGKQEDWTNGEIAELERLAKKIGNGRHEALHRALECAEDTLSEAPTKSYRDILRTFREPLITALDDATQEEGWQFMEEIIRTYDPSDPNGISNVTPILENVAGRYLIRTRLTEGVDGISVSALDFFEKILSEVGSGGFDLINEGLHTYGWGIGHQTKSVDENIHAHAKRDIFVVNAMLEHAFYADQQAAIDLLKKILKDETIEKSIKIPNREVDKTRYLLSAPARAASGHVPITPRYWQWQHELNYTFELDWETKKEIRKIVEDVDLDAKLNREWDIVDLLL